MSSSNAADDKQPNKQEHISGTDDSGNSNGEIPVRTIYVGDIHQSKYMSDAIKNYFAQFGEIQSVSVRSISSGYQYYLVQFKREQDARKALLHTKRWNGFAVRAADPWHQPDHPLQRPSEQDSKSNILNALNEDCNQEIFKRLKLPDLTNVAEVCVHFNQQAKITFALEHKHSLDLSNNSFHRQDLVETAMKHFGKDSQSLCINADLFTNEADAIRSIVQYCGPKLKQLELQRFQFKSNLVALRPIFAGIEQLTLLCGSDNTHLGALLSGCDELQSLSISFYPHGTPRFDRCIMKQTFPKLQELSLYCTNISAEIFENFVFRHPTLIKLSIDDTTMTSRALRTIGQHAKNLQELKFVHNDAGNEIQNNAEFCGQLSSLKKLQLHLRSQPMLPVLNAFVSGGVPIECMEIWFYGESFGDDVVHCVSQFKHIKILCLKTCKTHRVTDAHIIKLAKCLPELEELHLIEFHGYNDFESQLTTIGLRKMLMHANKLKLLGLQQIKSIKIDVDDYKMMLNTIQKRKEKVPLVIEIHGEEDQVDVPETVLAENRNMLNIKMIL